MLKDLKLFFPSLATYLSFIPINPRICHAWGIFDRLRYATRRAAGFWEVAFPVLANLSLGIEEVPSPPLDVCPDCVQL